MACDNSAKIAAIQSILETGATEITIDGERVRYDLDSLRDTLRQLQASDEATIAAGRTRPPKMVRCNLGSA